MSSSTGPHDQHGTRNASTHHTPEYPINAEVANLDHFHVRQIKLEEMKEKSTTARAYLVQHKKDLKKSQKCFKCAEARLRKAVEQSGIAEQMIQACRGRIEGLKPSETSTLYQDLRNKPSLRKENKTLKELERGLSELREERAAAQTALDRATIALNHTERTDPGGIYAIAHGLRAMVPYKPEGNNARYHNQYVEQNKLLTRLRTAFDDVLESEGLGRASGLAHPRTWASGWSSTSTL